MFIQGLSNVYLRFIQSLSKVYLRFIQGLSNLHPIFEQKIIIYSYTHSLQSPANLRQKHRSRLIRRRPCAELVLCENLLRFTEVNLFHIRVFDIRIVVVFDDVGNRHPPCLFGFCPVVLPFLLRFKHRGEGVQESCQAQYSPEHQFRAESYS